MKCQTVHKFHFNGVLFVCRRCGWWKRSPDDVPQAPHSEGDKS